MSDIEFFSKLKPKRLTSINEDIKNSQSEILADRARYAKFGTNSKKKAALLESGKVEELIRERFPEED